MKLGLTIWLVVFGVILIASFWLGSYYLSEWKEGVIEEAYYGVKKDNGEKMDYSAMQNYAKYVAQKKISLPIFLISYAFSLISVIAITVSLIGTL